MQAAQGLLTLSDTQKDSIRMALFVARASTYISKEILLHLGNAALHEACSSFQAVEMLRSHGRLAELPFEKPEIFEVPHSIPQGFSSAVLDGLELRKSPELNIEKIEAYAKRLDDQRLCLVLEWMVPWQMATYHYRAERYEAAYPFIQDAFEKAQYCAGGNQYILLNQYIELAAKNDKWRDFKRGIEWATYLGIEIRWLRKNKPTQENLQSVFEIMKKAVYAV